MRFVGLACQELELAEGNQEGSDIRKGWLVERRWWCISPVAGVISLLFQMVQVLRRSTEHKLQYA